MPRIIGIIGATLAIVALAATTAAPAGATGPGVSCDVFGPDLYCTGQDTTGERKDLATYHAGLSEQGPGAPPGAPRTRPEIYLMGFPSPLSLDHPDLASLAYGDGIDQKPHTTTLYALDGATS